MKRFRSADILLMNRAGKSEENAAITTAANECVITSVAKPPPAASSFNGARRTLHELLSSITFVRVISITNSMTPTHFSSISSSSTPAPYHGEAEEIIGGPQKNNKPRKIFFSGYSRQSNLGYSLGGCVTIVDSPLGADHISGVPQVGAILLGSVVSSSKAKARCPFELKGWCNNAKNLIDLHKIVQFGTRGGEAETRVLLRQPAVETAVEYASSMALCETFTLNAAQKRLCLAAAGVADELDCLARIVLYGKLDCLLQPCLRLGGRDPRAFVETLSIVLRDGKILQEYYKIAPPIVCSYEIPKQTTIPSSMSLTLPPHPFAPHSPAYEPSSPPYVPSSPPYVPSSPPYVPSSPPYVPSSPPYVPSSPPYVPSSPPYSKTTPPYNLI
jgi:hypothetical protein